MGIWLSRLASLAVVGGVLGAAAACEVPLPPARFTVSSAADLADADAGDGSCEATVGAGDCTLRAAVDEANALATSGRAPQSQVVVPAGTYPVAPGLVIGGHLVIEAAPGAVAEVDTGGLVVAAGAQLELLGMQLLDGAGSAPLQVDGVLVVRRSTLRRILPLTVLVSATGTLVAESSSFGNGLGIVLRNEGVALLRHVTVLASFASTTAGNVAVETTASGSTVLASSTLQSGPGLRWPAGRGVACGGTAPTSLGSNTAWDTSCGLTAAGDVQSVNPYQLVGGYPAATSVLVDAIAPGTNGCGTEVTEDQSGVARPQDGDGDGTSACDIGALERPAAP